MERQGVTSATKKSCCQGVSQSKSNCSEVGKKCWEEKIDPSCCWKNIFLENFRFYYDDGKGKVNIYGCLWTKRKAYWTHG